MYTLYLGLVELEKTVADHAAQLHGRVTHKDTTYEEYAAVTTNTQYGNSTVVMVPRRLQGLQQAGNSVRLLCPVCFCLPAGTSCMCCGKRRRAALTRLSSVSALSSGRVCVDNGDWDMQTELQQQAAVQRQAACMQPAGRSGWPFRPRLQPVGARKTLGVGRGRGDEQGG
jgi:hypothetical protein